MKAQLKKLWNQGKLVLLVVKCDCTAQYHRIVQVRKNLWNSSCSVFLLRVGSITVGYLGLCPSWIIDVSKEGVSKSSLGNGSVFDHFTVKNTFPCAYTGFLVYKFVSCPLREYHWERVFFFTPPTGYAHQVFRYIGKISPSLLFSKLNSSCSFSFSSHAWHLKFLMIFTILCKT